MTQSRLVIAMVLCPAMAFLIGACEEEAPTVSEQIRAIKTITITELASGQVRKYPGVVQATDSSTLSFQVSGNVQKVNVELGNQVKKDQVLATLDRKPYELAVQASQAELQRGRAALKEKKQAYQRQKKLFAKKWVSQAALDQAEAAHDSASSEVNYANSKLRLAKRDLDNTVLKAPFDGIIAARNVDPFVEVKTGQRLFEINAEGAIEAAFNIPESTVSQITIGMPITVTFPSDKSCDCRGRITEIGSVATSANAFPVKATLIDPPATVRAGMTAEVKFLIAGDDENAGFLIPLAALAPGGESKKGAVFVFDIGTSTVRRTEVRLAGATDNMVAIRDGVAAGDIVAVAGVSFLSDGLKVKLLTP